MTQLTLASGAYGKRLAQQTVLTKKWALAEYNTKHLKAKANQIYLVGLFDCLFSKPTYYRID